MIQRIVVPTDFSPCADNASLEAIRLVERSPCRLTFLHYFKTRLFQSPGSQRQETAQQLQHHVENLAREAGLLLPTHAEFLTKEGDLSDELPHFVTHHQVSLVVMGTRGSGNITARLFGSNTMKFIQESFTPVLAIPEGAHLGSMERLVYATDYSDLTGIAFEMTLKIAGIFQSTVTVLHIRHPHDHILRPHQKAFAPQLEVYSYKKIEKEVIRDEDTVHGLMEFITQKSPSILALSVKPESVLEGYLRNSVFHELILDAGLPILASR